MRRRLTPPPNPLPACEEGEQPHGDGGHSWQTPGALYQKMRPVARQEFLECLGYTVIRVTNEQALTDLDIVLIAIQQSLRDSPPRGRGRGTGAG